MCGIIALSGKQASKIPDAKISAMLSCLSKRGPDDKGFERFEDTVLGQTRLSIVDLSPAGHQPMKDNKFPLTIVFNGEIYDYKKLRNDLESKGHTFSSHSDTETILKAYAEYGKDCVKHLDGMFAFAIWDDAKKELFVARDRFGKKPFYYAFVNGLFVAASEIKSIFATELIKGKIDSDVLSDYLRLGYVPSYESIYSNIASLPPAHGGVVKNGTIETWQYWKLEKKVSKVSYKEAKGKIKELFADAVRKRMIADVEIGSLLSGGIDSTMVTAEAQKYMNRPIKTFSVGYGDAKNELPFAEAASKKIGTDHNTLVADKADLKELEEVVSYFDEPHADTSDFPQHLVSKLAGSKVKVALSGDGADELFMGYGWYQKHWHTPLTKRLFRTQFGSYKRAVQVFSEQEIKKLIPTNIPPSKVFETALSGIKTGIEKINAFDLSVYLPGQLLTKIDRTSMMHSVEVRSPFLDTKLAEYVYNLPVKFKLSKNENKIILKDIFSEFFPKDFVYRRKQGFGAPVAKWLENDMVIKKIDSILQNEKHPMFAYINREGAKVIRERAHGNMKTYGYKIWSLLTLALWFETHTS